jgi:hypothetical protein
MKDNLEDLFNNSEQLHDEVPEKAPPKIEGPSLSQKIKSFGKSMMSRGFTNKRCSPLVKQIRSLSCHGNEELAPCPHRKNSVNFEGSYHCGACGCGDKAMTQLSPIPGVKDNYGKLDFPAVSCPLKMPGFTDYTLSEDEDPDTQRRKEYINKMYIQIGVDMNVLVEEQKSAALKRRKQIEKDKAKKQAKRNKAKAKIEEIQKKYGIDTVPNDQQIFTPASENTPDTVKYYTKDPKTGKITARANGGKAVDMPGQVIEINQHNIEELVRQGKGSAVVESIVDIPDRKSKGGCTSCAKKKAAKERRNLKKKITPPPIDK